MVEPKLQPTLADREAAQAIPHSFTDETALEYEKRCLAVLPKIFADHRITALEAISAENAKLKSAMARDAVRFRHCASMIESSFNISGTLRIERAMKAECYAFEALETLAALKEQDE